jgi:hypothetical protein
MHLNAILFLPLFLFGPGPLSLSLSPLSFFSSAQPSPAGLSFFSSLHRTAQSSSRSRASFPRPNGPSPTQRPTRTPALSFPFSLSLTGGPACRGRLRPRARLGLEPESVHGMARPLPTRGILGPHAKVPRPPYKAAARALGSAHPAVAVFCLATLAAPPPSPPSSGTPPSCHSTTTPLPPSAAEAPREGGHRRRPFFPLFPRLLACAMSHRSSATAAAAVRLFPVPSRQPDPLDVLPIAPASFSCNPRSKPWPESRLRDSPASPLPPPPSAVTPQPQATSQPPDPDPTV